MSLTYVEKSPAEGAGSLFQSIVSTYALSKLFGDKFFYTSPTYIHHWKSNGVDLQRYISDWEKLFAFLPVFSSGSPSHNLSNPKPCLDYFFPEFEKKFPSHLSSMFWEHCSYVPSENFFSGPALAWHIRASNPEDSTTDPAYELFRPSYVPRYLKLAERLKEMFPEAELHIFSQGPESNFSAFSEISTLHLDTYAPDTFWHLAKADYLFQAKSSFSYLAGLMNSGKVLLSGNFRHAMGKDTIYL